MGDAMEVDVAGTAAAASEPPEPGAGDAPAGLAFDLVVSLEGHDKGVSSVRFSPDGTRLASASADKTVRIWRVADGACLATLVGHEKGCSECAWSKCGRYVVSASDDKNVHLWCVDPDAPQKTAPAAKQDANDDVQNDDVRTNDDVQNDDDDDVSNVQTRPAFFGECLRVFAGHTAHVFSVDLSPAGNVLVTGSVDETVRLWDVLRGTCMNVLPAHSDPVTSVRFSPDGTTVCSGSYDGLVRLWSVATGACLKTFRAGPGDARKKTFGNKLVTPGGVADDAYAGYNSAPPPPVGHVRFTPNGLFLLISTLDGCIRLADTRTGAVAKTFEGHKNKAFCVVSAFAAVHEISTTSHEGDDDEPKKEKSRFETYVLSGSEDGAACAWEIQSRRLVGRAGTPDAAVAGSSPEGDAAHGDAVVGVDFSAATQTLATCGLERDKTVKLWRVRRET